MRRVLNSWGNVLSILNEKSDYIHSLDEFRSLGYLPHRPPQSCLLWELTGTLESCLISIHENYLVSCPLNCQEQLAVQVMCSCKLGSSDTSLHNLVTIKCGPNLCHSCTQQSWQVYWTGFLACLALPVRSKEHFGRNAQLGRVTEIAELSHSTSNKNKRHKPMCLCKKHNQIPALFCGVDQEVCYPCVLSPLTARVTT